MSTSPNAQKIVAEPRFMIIYHRQDGGLGQRTDCTPVRDCTPLLTDILCTSIEISGRKKWLTAWLYDWPPDITWLWLFSEQIYKHQSLASGTLGETGLDRESLFQYANFHLSHSTCYFIVRCVSLRKRPETGYFRVRVFLSCSIQMLGQSFRQAARSACITYILSLIDGT